MMILYDVTRSVRFNREILLSWRNFEISAKCVVLSAKFNVNYKINITRYHGHSSISIGIFFQDIPNKHTFIKLTRILHDIKFISNN